MCRNEGASQVELAVKNPPANAGDLRGVDLITGSGRSPGGGHSNPLQCSCLENPVDRGAWWATVHGVAKSWTQGSDLACTHRNETARAQSVCVFNSLGTLSFHHGWTVLCSHHYCVRFPVSMHPHQHLWLSAFFIIAIIVSMKWCLSVVLICIPLWLMVLSIFSCTYWLFANNLFGNVYSDLLLIFYLSF